MVTVLFIEKLCWVWILIFYSNQIIKKPEFYTMSNFQRLSNSADFNVLRRLFSWECYFVQNKRKILGPQLPSLLRFMYYYKTKNSNCDPIDLLLTHLRTGTTSTYLWSLEAEHAQWSLIQSEPFLWFNYLLVKSSLISKISGKSWKSLGGWKGKGICIPALYPGGSCFTYFYHTAEYKIWMNV